MGNVTLEDISLKKYKLDNLPRLKQLRDLSYYRSDHPEICIERARWVTDYLRKYDNRDDSPEIRQAKKINHFLANKAAVFLDDNLLAGTTTSKPLGAPLFPEFFALTLWPELETVSKRKKNPQQLTPEDADELNSKIFPFWMNGNVQEIARQRLDDPTPMALFERLVFYIAGKNGGVSHCIPSYEVMLQKGLNGLIDEVSQKAAAENDKSKADFYRAVAIGLQGIIKYAERLAKKAELLATTGPDETTRREFSAIAAVCRQVPANPARSFREAVNAIWICQVGLLAENINMAMSPGRLDQVLYPYYQNDIENKTLKIEEALELLGCLWLKISDNVVMVPEASEEMFGGAGSVPAITLGGIDAQGGDAVNDLTYLMLKVTELLEIRDPNVNARYYPGVNSREYIDRVSQVILNTRAVPAVFNDVKNIEALRGQQETLEHARDYGVVGCVELASVGRDYSAPSAIMLNLSAVMEMALFRGKRPVTGDEQIGPATTAPEKLNSYEEFWEVFTTQLDWLVEQAVTLNNTLGKVHQDMMPSPILSSFFPNTMQEGRDLIQGGANYNSSGATHVGFADVVDSLNAIEYAVFKEKKFTFAELMEAIKNNYRGQRGEVIRQYMKNRAPKYGTEEDIARNNATRLTKYLFDLYQSKTNYRQGPYRPAYWTMTNHAGLGKISGALPHGRKKGELFASGITPVSGAAPDLTACLNAVAELGGENVPGCWALNLKYTPENEPAEARKKFRETLEAYFLAGGQQIQFNIMTYETLCDARKHPDKHPHLMVRVSGYSAYFNDLNDMMKEELITRTQFNLQDGTAVPFPQDEKGRLKC